MKTAKTPIKSQAKSQYNNNNNQHNRPDVSISPAY